MFLPGRVPGHARACHQWVPLPLLLASTSAQLHAKAGLNLLLPYQFHSPAALVTTRSSAPDVVEASGMGNPKKRDARLRDGGSAFFLFFFFSAFSFLSSLVFVLCG